MTFQFFLFMFLHFVGRDVFSLCHISSVYHFNLDGFPLWCPLAVSPVCHSLCFPWFLLSLCPSFITRNFCLIPPDPFSALTSCFSVLKVCTLDDFDTFLDCLIWITACFTWTRLNINVFFLPFGRQPLRQQSLLTPTVLIDLFQIRAMNFNDDDSLKSHSHLTLERVGGTPCAGQGFHHFL